jgi:hypothetical protein
MHLRSVDGTSTRRWNELTHTLDRDQGFVFPNMHPGLGIRETCLDVRYVGHPQV